MALNREQKRHLKKSGELSEDGQPTPSRATRTAPKPVPSKDKRTPPRVFIKEVRGELRKVAWPTRAETTNYSLVVAITLIVLGTLIFGLDWVFSEVVLRLFNAK
jgi:preprotein translocase subunit SecE